MATIQFIGRTALKLSTKVKAPSRIIATINNIIDVIQLKHTSFVILPL